MNRKRNNRDGDWFTDNGWNIDDIFGNLDSEFRKMRKQMDDLMRDAVEGNSTDNSSKKPLVFGFSVTTVSPFFIISSLPIFRRSDERASSE